MFLRHEPCPRCVERGRDRSGNNLAVWDDHSWCFSCGYRVEANPLKKLKQQQEPQFHICGIETKLPDDVTTAIPIAALKWIKKYGITNDEIEQHKVCWSERKQLLVFPICDCDDKLIAWCGRYFGPNEKHPKYLTYGMGNSLYHIIGPLGGTIVVVEDIVSAIKVARYETAMPLFTSDIQKHKLIRLSRMFDNLVIWLDPDKKAHSVKLSKRADGIFKNVKTIWSDVDPKEVSDESIKECLQ